MAEFASVAAASFIIALSGAIVPGAVFGIAVNRAFRKGVWAGTSVSVGHVAVEAVLVVGLWFGVGRVLASRPVVTTVSLVGGVVLLLMGYDMARAALKGLRSGAAARDSEPHSKPNAGPHPTGLGLDSLGPVFAGVVATVANPYWIVWWATVGTRYVGMAAAKGPGVLAAFASGHMAADVGWLFVVSLSVAAGRNLLASRGYFVLSLVLGLFVAGIGLYFVYSGVGAI